jgi:hypothetical protein
MGTFSSQQLFLARVRIGVGTITSPGTSDLLPFFGGSIRERFPFWELAPLRPLPEYVCRIFFTLFHSPSASSAVRLAGCGLEVALLA